MIAYRTAEEGSRIKPERQVLVVKEDITQDECYVGAMISYFEQLWIVDDLDCQTPFGTFIRMLAIEEEKDAWVDHWIQTDGVPHSPHHRYRVLHLITFELNRGIQTKLGFVIKNEQTGQFECLSYREAWEIAFRHGAINARASSSTFGKMTTHLLDSIDGLPPFDSHYWRISLQEAELKWRQHFSPDFQRVIDIAVRRQIRNHQTVQSKEGSSDISE